MDKEKAEFCDTDSVQIKIGLAEMLKEGVIFEVTTPDEAKIAERAGALGVMVSSKLTIDADIIQSIQKSVTIPVMARCRIGHFAEASILEALFLDFIDESERLVAADPNHHIDKHAFRIPFICSYGHLGEALQRIGEGATVIRTRDGELSLAVCSMRRIQQEIRKVRVLDRSELMVEATRMGAPYDLLCQVADTGQLPVPNFASGGIVTPADVALFRGLGAEGLFVDASIFSAPDPFEAAHALVLAAHYFEDHEMLAKIVKGDDVSDVVVSESSLLAKDEPLGSRVGW